jgi:hypothetical protein
VAVGAHLTVNIKIIQENEFPGNGMMVRCDLFPEQYQPRITIAFRYVAKYLVVCSFSLITYNNILIGEGSPTLRGLDSGLSFGSELIVL